MCVCVLCNPTHLVLDVDILASRCVKQRRLVLLLDPGVDGEARADAGLEVENPNLGDVQLGVGLEKGGG